MIIINKSEELGEVLKNARKKAGLSQSDVATKLGYSSGQFISNWERGLAAPPAVVIYDLVKLYKMKESEILDVIIRDIKKSWKKLNTTSKIRKSKTN